MSTRSQRHKVKWQGVASNGERRANDAFPDAIGTPVTPPATVVSLSSNSVPVNTGIVTLVVTGTNFDQFTTIVIGVVDLAPTTFVNPTTVQAALDTSLFVPGVQQVGVRRGVQLSNTLPLTFTA
jgi:hypothetical protein